MILPHRKRPAETLYIYEQDCEGWRDHEYGEAPYYRCGKWRVSLGPEPALRSPPPTWREHLRSLGHRLDTVADVERILAEESLTPEELDSPLDGFGWEDMWDNFNGPQAKAYHLLKEPTSVLTTPAEASRRGHLRGVWRRSRQHLHLG